MTTESEKTEGGGPSTLVLLEEAEGLFREAAEEMFGLLKSMKAGRLPEPKSVQHSVRDLKTALEWVMDERVRLEKRRKTLAEAAGESGGGGDGGINLAAARDEIGRRLACLRHARGD